MLFALVQEPATLDRLDMQELALKISQNLTTYLRKVEEETGRNVVVYLAAEQPTSSGSTAFFNRTSDGEVRITLTAPVEFGSPAIEAAVAHEATHGVLIYGDNYCDAGFRMPDEVPNRAAFNALQGQFGAFEVVTSILEDINVDKRVQLAGFEPIDDNFRAYLREGMDAANSGRDPYPSNVRPQHRLAHNVFNGYILTWAYREYLNLSEEDRALFTEYLAAFEKAYPEDLAVAKKIRAAIEDYNIFTRNGHLQILREAIRVMDLKNVVITCTEP